MLRPDLPFALQLELTSNCNLRCVMCPLTTGTSSTSGDIGHVTEATWEQVLLVARRCQQVFIAGYGEPLTDPRCLDLLGDLDDHGVSVSIATNGLVLTAAIARRLAGLRHLSQVNVSIDSPDPTVYREVRGGSLRRALQGLRNLVAALDPSQVTVSSVLMASNAPSLVAFPALLAEIGVHHYELQGVMDYNELARSSTLLGSSEAGGLLTRIREECERHGVYLVVGSQERLELELADPELARERFHEQPADQGATRTCMVPWEVPFVDKDGTVFACCFAAASNARPLGNLHERSFEAIWTGDEFQAFRSDLLDGRTTPDVCRRCTVVPWGAHPLQAWAAELVPGSLRVERGAVHLQVRNTGGRTWLREDLVRLGSRDGDVAFADESWLFPHRPATFDEEAVAPGDRGTFSFRVAPGPMPVAHRLHLVVEGVLWLPGFHVDVEVPAASPSIARRLGRRLALRRPDVASLDRSVAGFAADIVPGSVTVVGDLVRVEARNVGTRPWSAADHVYVGTAWPRDAPSPVAHPSWVRPNRACTFDDALVRPGEVATFQFRVAPAAGLPPQVFQLVADGFCWLAGTSFEVERAVAAPSPAPHVRSGVSRRDGWRG